jgi:hypothetical protein
MVWTGEEPPGPVIALRYHVPRRAGSVRGVAEGRGVTGVTLVGTGIDGVVDGCTHPATIIERAMQAITRYVKWFIYA